ncbi:c-type cytochrome biogenesis protein CcmI [Pseudomonas citronellolis]|jgi:cytochrome c-type biogenesis protein CcmH|uniref:c-type cytochrome biogenesis protein CcmI n=1 Tax=Pseudomonas citronellolis TaxID=53408 RepID=UPI0018D5EA5E|nr:c-type cytochrome biogenesis protein CcmI [Pseudomonas citronellolis]MBH3434738.1 c-type cytochrome biogenesis protein CcmI [Pseudomonas citronellolis]MCP1605049.1 cytochrome c-type biogenesis protein CcmH [Pseudomonas citronellolis]MCP1655897.1 cytochrome c-type biogenesis protein CcmH [Pseudomonas citronellolis]MCP1723088.1 cytochrome c-type biogenesis protein CcmH [Pseudomonas citronellolis]UXJ51111.1 c-type cytochrome biogenesis protein CcmI [Pseudomonas citronellolis]
MIDFWLAAGLLALVAMAFLLIPLLRGRRAQAEEDRTALNVALYQERLAELDAQHAAGTLDDAQLQAGRAEAARELLADTEGEGERRSRLGRAAPLLAAVLLPLLGLGLYLHWGASEKLALSRELAEPPHSMAEMTERLEKAVQAQPDSAEGWYFLGRTYMTQERFEDAAKAFERAANLSGRQSEVLGQWAQALYFANGKKMAGAAQALADEALKQNPEEVTTLGLMGIAAFEDQRYADAVDYWQRLVAALPADDPSRAAIQSGIERARQHLAERGEKLPEAPAAAATAGVTLKVRVDLSDAVKGQVKPDDSVFVFARAVNGPPMPLAVKRLKVADLPDEVSLSDADAMMPQLKLSAFPKVELVARVSRAGNAISGEWIGRSQPLSTAGAGDQAVTIDSPDQH